MSDDVRQKLVQAGLDLLAGEGSAALSLREIARRAGVSHGAPRRYFPTHRDLLAAIAREGYRDLAGQVSAAATVADLGRAYLRFARDQPQMFTLMFRHDLLRGNAEGLRQDSRSLFGTLVRLVATARPGFDRPEIAAASLWANLHGIAQLGDWGSLQMITGSDDLEPVLQAALDAHLG